MMRFEPFRHMLALEKLKMVIKSADKDEISQLIETSLFECLDNLQDSRTSDDDNLASKRTILSQIDEKELIEVTSRAI